MLWPPYLIVTGITNKATKIYFALLFLVVDLIEGESSREVGLGNSQQAYYNRSSRLCTLLNQSMFTVGELEMEP